MTTIDGLGPLYPLSPTSRRRYLSFYPAVVPIAPIIQAAGYGCII